MNAVTALKCRRPVTSGRVWRCAIGLVIIASTSLAAQQGGRGDQPPGGRGAPPAGGRGEQAPPGRGGPPGGRGAQPPRTARAAAPVDLTGYWVSIVTEDWRWRMVTPAKGDFAGVPLNPAARALGAAWDPAKDEKEGNQCKAYGAAAIMRAPGRLHITWQDDQTLRIETDYGTQIRLLHFDASRAPRGEPSWQGLSIANWERPLRGPGLPVFIPIGLNAREGTEGRSLEVVTTNLRPGYLRKNGVPYGSRTTLREYFDLFTEPDGATWFTVTSIVEDPEHLTEPYVTSSDFRKQADATGWSPTPCTTR